MSTTTVFVHLDYDVWDHRETEAIRVSCHGRADVYLPQGQRATGQWDGANTAAVAGSIAHRFGLDDAERARAVLVESVPAIERNDPRWIVTFAL
ncbi:hypothetical protein BTO20_19465 [Mycobacterium dioxanotrophicus]|uniref:Uncharacterized protein n=1 Tax=Mycobacterium dioxanotrophicus TaxID=482462 RepID=A0A1Y0C5H1_9MYCO|nr:hypothetical protein [Mycobacterium dioxanotrophicus]ART70453.1 hypothetical protein BTO20_19465 [Mycobacterium dioxanotrophicus]